MTRIMIMTMSNHGVRGYKYLTLSRLLFTSSIAWSTWHGRDAPKSDSKCKVTCWECGMPNVILSKKQCWRPLERPRRQQQLVIVMVDFDWWPTSQCDDDYEERHGWLLILNAVAPLIYVLNSVIDVEWANRVRKRRHKVKMNPVVQVPSSVSCGVVDAKRSTFAFNSVSSSFVTGDYSSSEAVINNPLCSLTTVASRSKIHYSATRLVGGLDVWFRRVVEFFHRLVCFICLASFLALARYFFFPVCLCTIPLYSSN
jgi:hypothetical protein